MCSHLSPEASGAYLRWNVGFRSPPGGVNPFIPLSSAARFDIKLGNMRGFVPFAAFSAMCQFVSLSMGLY